MSLFLDFLVPLFLYLNSEGNERLQEMMRIMAGERGGTVFATDERSAAFVSFCVTLLRRNNIGSA